MAWDGNIKTFLATSAPKILAELIVTAVEPQGKSLRGKVSNYCTLSILTKIGSKMTDDWYDEYYKDPYHVPHKFGLEVVAEVELSEPCYSFDIAMVWWHLETDAFYVAQDSGCSCPSPFEVYTELGDLTGPLTKHEAAEWLKDFIHTEGAEGWNYADDPAKVVAGIEKVMNFRA